MIEIRKLEPDDTESYRALWLYGITEHSTFFRIAPDNDLPMGIVSFERDPRTKARHKGLISRMFIHPDSAGQGAGKELLKHLIYLANDLGDLRYLYLTVLASNTRAIHLYSSLQFREFAREPGAVLINGSYIDELQMAHQLVGT
jgi:cyclohexyl-isocyanide hydratase